MNNLRVSHGDEAPGIVWGDLATIDPATLTEADRFRPAHALVSLRADHADDNCLLACLIKGCRELDLDTDSYPPCPDNPGHHLLTLPCTVNNWSDDKLTIYFHGCERECWNLAVEAVTCPPRYVRWATPERTLQVLKSKEGIYDDGY